MRFGIIFTSRFSKYGVKCVYFSRGGGGSIFQKTAFLRHFLKFNLDFKKKFCRYDQKIYRGVEEFLGEHFPIYRILIDLFNMSAEGGGSFELGVSKNVIKSTYFQLFSK